MIPAHPLALDARRRLDERRQRALTRYYAAAGAGGVAVGVHTTQFAIRDVGLYRPLLELAADTARRDANPRSPAMILVAGVSGDTRQAVGEAETAAALGYHAALVSMGALPTASTDDLLQHAQAIAAIMPVFGFYLQPAAGGRALDAAFWRRLVEIDQVVGIKIAPFDRYETAAVVGAVAGSGRADEVALYTGNDDHILLDLLTPFQPAPGRPAVRMVGGLLGQWAMWTHRAVEHHAACRRAAETGDPVSQELMTLAAQLTDANAAIFDPRHGFAGCIPGIHEVLRRQGLLAGTWCLDPAAGLSPGQAEEIDRVWDAYPGLRDDAFVREHLDAWLR